MIPQMVSLVFLIIIGRVALRRKGPMLLLRMFRQTSYRVHFRSIDCFRCANFLVTAVYLLAPACEDGCSCYQLLSSSHQDLPLLLVDFFFTLHAAGAPILRFFFSALFPVAFLDSLSRLSCV